MKKVIIVLSALLVVSVIFNVFMLVNKPKTEKVEISNVDNSIKEDIISDFEENTFFTLDRKVIDYNQQFKEYFGPSVSGDIVLELLDIIINNNNNSAYNKIGIDPNFISVNGGKYTKENCTDSEIIENEIKSNLDVNDSYIVKELDSVEAYSQIGVLQRISILDDTNISGKELEEFNDEFKPFFGENIKGKTVKELLNVIKTHNKKEYETKREKCVRVVVHLYPKSTTNGKKYYDNIGYSEREVNSDNYLNEYINAIINDENYYVNCVKLNPDGSIFEIVVSDDFYKYNYIQ